LIPKKPPQTTLVGESLRIYFWKKASN